MIKWHDALDMAEEWTEYAQLKQDVDLLLRPHCS